MALVTTTGPRTALQRTASSPDELHFQALLVLAAPIAAAGDKRSRVSSSSSQSAASHGWCSRGRSENAGAALELPRFPYLAVRRELAPCSRAPVVLSSGAKLNEHNTV